MALPVLPNPSNFLGVALVINRSRDGPRFVFHYPAHVVSAQHRAGSGPEDEADAEGHGPERGNDRGGHEHDLDYDYQYEEGGDFGPDGEARRPGAQGRDGHVFTENGAQLAPWEHVAGFPTKDLESILTPARAYHKRLFQVSLDPIYCVSYPVYAPENGIWRKKKKEHPARGKARGRASGSLSASADETPLPALDPDAVRRLGGAEPAPGGGGGKAPVDDEGGDGAKISSMTMFNLVFFLDPKKHEAGELVNTMYAHIIRKINKVYKFCQQRNDFVWKESKRILALKDKAREERRAMASLWSEILATSSLAASMQDVYDAVSQNKIAVLQLDAHEGAVTHSVQVPAPFHISDLPLQHQQRQQLLLLQEEEAAAANGAAGPGSNARDRDRDDALGLWITTANSFVAAGADDDDEVAAGAPDGPHPGFLDKNFALLLMDDDKKIVSELQSDPDEATAAMIEFMKLSKPTLSFHQVASQSSLLNLAQVRKFAHHFIFWRRAIAIPPLHARDVYILSPNCDPSRLPRASVEFARTFQWAPALTNILADLSAAPRPYKFFCPSKHLRPEYMRILIWLMRGGWVTQLCTFAYVVVWPEVIYEVEHALEAEDVAKFKAASAGAASAAAGVSGPPTSPAGGEIHSEPQPGAAAGASSSTPPPSRSSSSASRASPSSSPSPPLPARSRASSSSRSSEATAGARDPGSPGRPARPRTQPTAAQQAAEKARLGRLADKAARELAEKASAHARKPAPTRTPHPSVNNAPHLAHLSPHVILDPKTATGKESLYLSAIARRLRERSALIAAAAGAAADPGASGPGAPPPPPPSASLAVPRPLSSHGSLGPGLGAAAAWTGVGAGSRLGADAATDGSDADDRVALKWPLFCRYFNGHCALERIALQEDMKRREVWALLTSMSEHLLCVRHW